jgi:hypothetical protein
MAYKEYFIIGCGRILLLTSIGAFSLFAFAKAKMPPWLF